MWYSYFMPAPSSRSISIETSTILKIVAVALGLMALWAIRDILLLLFSAILIAGVMYPGVQKAVQYHIPRGVTVLMFYLFLFGLLGASVTLLVPALFHETHSLVATYGSQIAWVAHAFNISIPLAPAAGGSLTLPSFAPATLQEGVSDLLAILPDVFVNLASFAIVLALGFYFIVEEAAIHAWFRQLIPEAYQATTSRLIGEAVEKLGGWLRGQLLLGFLIGSIYFIGLSLIQVPYALLLALCAGLFEFVPYIGPMFAAVPMAFIALSLSPLRLGMTIAFLLTVQQMEGHIFVPQIMHKTVGLNPIVSVVAFAIGVKVFGLGGAIFSIPVATATSVVLAEYLRWHEKKSRPSRSFLSR